MKPKTHRSTTSLTHSWTNSNLQFNKSLFLKVPIARTPSFCSLPYCPIQGHCMSYYGHKKLCHKRGSTSNPKGLLGSRDQAMARGLMNKLKEQRRVDEGLLYQFRRWSRWSIDWGAILKGKESSRVAGKLTPSTEWGNRRRRRALPKIKNRNIFVTFVTCRRLLQMHSIDAHVNFRIPFPFLGAWKNGLLLF